MSVTNINTHSELTMARELPGGMSDGIVLPDDQDATWVHAPRSILQSALAGLSDGRISEVLEQFDERFENDHAVGLEFRRKARLTAFLEKSRELFPDTAVKIVSLFQIGEYAFAEWKRTATQTLSCASIKYRIPIDILGCTIVRVKEAEIVQ